jgi:hypothetical protein
MNKMRKIEIMHRLYGVRNDHICGECSNFYEFRYNKKYFKCEVYGHSSSEATDWRKYYVACGHFNKPPTAASRPVKEYAKREPAPIEILPGQMRLEI